MFIAEYRERKWRVVNEVGQTVVIVEITAGADKNDCEALANHLADFMTKVQLWA